MKRMLLSGLLAAALVLPPGAEVFAQARDIDESRPADPDARIEIEEIIVGSLRIVGWDRNEMRVTGTIGADVEYLEIDGDESSWEIRAEWPDRDHDDEGRRIGVRDRDRDRNHEHREVSVDLEVRIPVGASLQVEGVTISVEVEGVDGPISVETVTGSIDYAGSSREVDLTTVTGRIGIDSAEVDRLDVESVQGDIEFRGALGASARATFEAVGGSIVLEIPADTSASFDIETMMGRIDNEFGQEAVRESRWVPSSELQFSLGGGDARVTVETLQGSVDIRRR